MDDVGIARSSEKPAARCGVYRLLARLWQREVDQEMLRELRSPQLRDAFEAVGGAVPDHDSTSLAQLAIDYCQLFIGPTNHLPPFQSVWQNGQFCSDSAVSMRQFVDIVGYDASPLPNGMFLDQLGVQFDVMAHILGQIPACEPDEVEAVLELAQSFFTTHLRWPKDLLTMAEDQAATGFYRSLMVLTRDFLESELQE